MSTIKFKKLRSVASPSIGSPLSAGIDFYIPDDFVSISLGPGSDVLIPLGLSIEIPKDTALIMYNKSGVATRKKLILGACVIDADYQGEIHVHLFNAGRGNTIIQGGDKIVQGVLQKLELNRTLEEVETIHEETTERGTGGFGSTGTKANSLEHGTI